MFLTYLSMVFIVVTGMYLCSAKFTGRTYEPGVESGEWVQYRVSGNYTGFLDYYKMRSMTIFVENVSGQLVEVGQNITYSNGSTQEVPWPAPVNVSNPFTPYIIAGGLEAGDVWDWGRQEKVVNETVEQTLTKRYADKEYTVNYYSSERGKNESWVWKNVFWEQKSGFMLEGHLWIRNATSGFVAVDIHLQSEKSFLIRYWPEILVGSILIGITFIGILWKYLLREK